MSLGMTYFPAVPVGGAASYKRLHIVMVTGKCTDVFRRIFLVGGGGELRADYVGGSFHGGTSHGERDFEWRGRRIF